MTARQGDQAVEDGTVSFGARLVGSPGFGGLFREGMGLVEETASYLDGDGRAESRRRPPTGIASREHRINAASGANAGPAPELSPDRVRRGLSKP